MNSKRQFLSAAVALSLLGGCGVVDTIKEKISEALANLTALTEGNLEQLVATTSSSAKTASEQLTALSGKTDVQSLSSRFGSLTQAKANMSLIPQQDGGDVTDKTCVTIDRTLDEDGTRRATSVYADCPDGRAGVVTATAEEITAEETGNLSAIKLGVEFDNYAEKGRDGTRLKNGLVDWKITFKLDWSGVIITSNEQTTLLVTRTNEEGAAIPTTVQNNATMIYDITPAEGTLEIDGSSSFTQNNTTSTLSFARVVFDFDGPDKCEKGPRAGSVSLKNAAGEFIAIRIDDCGFAYRITSGTPAGDPGEKLTDAQVQNVFEETLLALADFKQRIEEFRNKKFKNAQCDADIPDDKFENAPQFHGGNTSVVDNNTPEQAATIVLNEGPNGEYGISLPGNVLKDADWYTATLPAGTYILEALPKSIDAIWPFVCAFTLDSSGKPVPISGDPSTGNLFDYCFPGGIDFSVGETRDVYFLVFDPFEEYSCLTYKLAVYDPASGFTPPAINTDASGGDCDPSWIDDGVCDEVCVPIWEERGLDTSPELNNDCSAAAAECPRFYIGDGICDSGCIYIWGPDATNPDDATKKNGLTDGGDCLSTNPDNGCQDGEGFCIIDYQCGPPASMATSCGSLTSGATGCPAGTNICLVDAPSDTWDCIPTNVSCPNGQ